MKKIKQFVLGILLAMSMMAVTACGSGDNNETTMGTSTSQTSTGTMTETTMSETRTNASDNSTGVIDGVMDDVESGAKDMMDETTGNNGTSGTDTTK